MHGALVVDCAAYGCGGLGNEIRVLTTYTLLAFILRRAVFFHIEPPLASLAASPLLDWRAGPPAGTRIYDGERAQTLILQKYDDSEQHLRNYERLGAPSFRVVSRSARGVR